MIRDLVVDRDAVDRIIQAGGYISETRARPPRRTAPWSRSPTRNGRRCRRLHRLWRLRRRLPERLGPLFTGAKSATWASSRKVSPGATAACSPWCARWMPKASATAPTSVSAPLSARRSIPLETISRLNRDLISALTHGGSHWPKAAPRRDELEEEEPDIIGF